MSYIQDMQYKKDHMHEFDSEGIHKITGTSFDKNGYDWEGYDSIGYNKQGINRFGFDMYGRNTEPFYDYDVGERRDRQQERLHDFKKENKHIVSKKYSYKNTEKVDTQSYIEKINDLEEKLEYLRKRYKMVKINDTLPEYEKEKRLKKISQDAIYIKDRIYVYKKIAKK